MLISSLTGGNLGLRGTGNSALIDGEVPEEEGMNESANLSRKLNDTSLSKGAVVSMRISPKRQEDTSRSPSNERRADHFPLPHLF